MKSEIDPATLTALGNVLEHFWMDEERDYNATPEKDRPGHVFESLQKLHQFFEEATYDGPRGGGHHPSKGELVNIVEDFRAAALRLSEAWELLGELEVEDGILSAGYPFPNCFIETAASISAWCSMAADKLRRLPEMDKQNRTGLFSYVRSTDGCDEVFDIHGPDGFLFSLPFWEKEHEAEATANGIVEALNNYHAATRKEGYHDHK